MISSTVHGGAALASCCFQRKDILLCPERILVEREQQTALAHGSAQLKMMLCVFGRDTAKQGLEGKEEIASGAHDQQTLHLFSTEST